MKGLMREIKKEYGLFNMIDMVWNHTANNSDWLLEHPEAGYNLDNSPHLKPAYQLELALLEFSNCMDTKYHLDKEIKTLEQLDSIMRIIKDDILIHLKLFEYFVLDTHALLLQFKTMIEGGRCDSLGEDQYATEFPVDWCKKATIEELGLQIRKIGLTASKEGERYGKIIKMEVLYFCMKALFGLDMKKFLSDCLTLLEKTLDVINVDFYKQYDDTIKAILTNVYHHIKHARLDEHGGRKGPITKDSPLIENYFTVVPHFKGSDNWILANNGWIFNGDPMVDFASSQSQAYLRRDVIVWSDCVKLRYGATKEDSPYLWSHMREYTLMMASMFDGFRIDNCHTTPMQLAKYLLDEARKINPNLYVVAELFTGSEEKDLEFVQHLGLNSLIREAMQAHDSFELSRLSHKYGGHPIGSLPLAYSYTNTGHFNPVNSPLRFENCKMIKVEGDSPHTLYMDCTHDNQTPHQKRTAEDALPNAAIVAFTCCAIGSVKGYDELHKKHLDIIHSTQLYPLYKDKLLSIGMCSMKRILMDYHTKFSTEGYDHIYVHHDRGLLIINREHPITHNGVVLIARTAFNKEHNDHEPIKLFHCKAEIVLNSKLNIGDDPKEDKQFVFGFQSSIVETKSQLIQKEVFQEVDLGQQFTPGSIMIIETTSTSQYPTFSKEEIAKLKESIAKLSLSELNILLYRVNEEEKDYLGPDHGTYNIPNYGPLIYAGLESWYSLISDVLIKKKDLGHGLCQNLRDGDWAMDYLVNRLKLYNQSGLYPIIQWLEFKFQTVKLLARHLIPRYFTSIIIELYKLTKQDIHNRITQPRFIQSGSISELLSLLQCTPIQLSGIVKSTSLNPRLSQGQSMAAGLPHFATHHMRVWGRDTFIALKGLYLRTGHFQLAKLHILEFASTVKHGLIPNLLDTQKFPRYNARDSPWWFLEAIKQYCTIVPNGLEILDDLVKLRFNDQDEFILFDQGYQVQKSLKEIIHQIIEAHYRGIEFREWNAGSNLDEHMQQDGFNITIKMNPNTGFLMGGNRLNCGTWMDKMGSHDGCNKGKPSTSRNGAPIEITALLFSVLSWLDELPKFPFKSVQNGLGEKFGLKEWAQLILTNFEKFYYIPSSLSNNQDYCLDEGLVNKKGIYKDVYGSLEKYPDYQLRCNYSIAMAIAPQLFNPNHALKALEIVGKTLVGPLGIKTLEIDDAEFRPNYINSLHSDDPSISQGANYHQGPEWLWPLPFYYQALLYFTKVANGDLNVVIDLISLKMIEIKRHIRANPYKGLTELTNANGIECLFSSPTQAWSNATWLDLIYSLAEDYNTDVIVTNEESKLVDELSNLVHQSTHLNDVDKTEKNGDKKKNKGSSVSNGKVKGNKMVFNIEIVDKIMEMEQNYSNYPNFELIYI